ncbi:MAG: gamma-glutamylcyclotransferase, partial [Rhodospirillaceae bacterium]|nr:gamma-glutamylcyclotransferase [Rhodospirillaceae bacterium]
MAIAAISGPSELALTVSCIHHRHSGASRSCREQPVSVPYTPVPPPPGDPPLDPAAPWVFAYGSLMWRPGFAPAEIRAAKLEGYHRD